MLLVNQADFVSPAMMHWTRSGDLIVDGGAGRHGLGVGAGDRRRRVAGARRMAAHAISVVGQLVTGQSVGAAKEYWALILGPMLLLVVLFARGGIDGMLPVSTRGGAVADASAATSTALTKRFGGILASD